MKVLVLGGVAAGTKVAAKLLREDRSCEVTILTKGAVISYAGCGLPYYVGNVIHERGELIVNTPEKFARLTGAAVLTRTEAIAVRPGEHKVEAKNLQTLGFIHNGMRQLTNSKRSVVTPDDIKALKLRVPGGEPFMRAFTDFGADPLTMSFSELYTALSQGTVDGQENGYDLIFNNSFHEVQPYITEWNYSYGAFALVVNSGTWDKLNDATKKVLEDAAAEVCRTGCQNVVDSESTQKQSIIDYGCEVNTLSEEQVKAFQDVLVGTGYYDYFYEKYGADAFEAFGIDIETLRG